jgi:hypothetical protein
LGRRRHVDEKGSGGRGAAPAREARSRSRHGSARAWLT